MTTKTHPVIRTHVLDSMTRRASPAVRSRDTVIGAATQAELTMQQRHTAELAATDLGNVYDGHFKAILQALSPKERTEIRDKVVAGVDQMNTYERMQGSPSASKSSPTHITDANASARRTVDSISAINEANRRFWEPKGK